MTVGTIFINNFLQVFVSIFFVQFHFSYKREIMISDESTESVLVSFLLCFYKFVLFIHILASKIIKCYLYGLLFRKIVSHANTKAHVLQNKRRFPMRLQVFIIS